jgi:nucleotide-binding universal stress UspA family protein
MPFRNVIAGTDLAAGGADALALARRLAQPAGAGPPAGGRVTAIHVVEHRGLFPRPHRAGRRPTPPPDDVECADAASAPRGLTELAGERGADLVVIGSRRGTPDGRTGAGRTALRLLQGAPCAVAVAAAGVRDDWPFRHVGVAYDGSPEACAALAAAYEIAQRDHAAATLYRVLATGHPATIGGIPVAEVEAFEQRERLRAQEQLDAAADAAPEGVNPRTVLLHGDPAREIASAADGVIDLLVIGSRGYGPFQRALAGSVSEGLLLHATQPVIVTPRGAAAAADTPAAEGA